METTMTISKSTPGATENLAAASAAEPQRSPQGSWAPRRRSSRVTLDIPVEVYGQGPDGRIFHEETRTRIVSAHGALVSLATDVVLGQMIVLVCKRTREEMQCRIVYREEITKKEVHIGAAFLTPAPKFWGVTFPPEDWDRAERKGSGIPSI